MRKILRAKISFRIDFKKAVKEAGLKYSYEHIGYLDSQMTKKYFKDAFSCNMLIFREYILNTEEFPIYNNIGAVEFLKQKYKEENSKGLIFFDNIVEEVVYRSTEEIKK